MTYELKLTINADEFSTPGALRQMVQDLIESELCVPVTQMACWKPLDQSKWVNIANHLTHPDIPGFVACSNGSGRYWLFKDGQLITLRDTLAQCGEAAQLAEEEIAKSVLEARKAP